MSRACVRVRHACREWGSTHCQGYFELGLCASAGELTASLHQGQGSGLLEIKCPFRKQEVPDVPNWYYMPQVGLNAALPSPWQICSVLSMMIESLYHACSGHPELHACIKRPPGNRQSQPSPCQVQL